MGWPIYSERFVQTAADGVWAHFNVPLGKRAVIKSIMSFHGGTQPGNVQVYAAAWTIYYHPFPASAELVVADVMVVVYGGEALGAIVNGPNVTATICGYLFDDAGRRDLRDLVADQGEPSTGPPPIEPLPIDAP